MSEYQYYEFQALDQRLTEEEQKYIHTLSSRVQLTSTQAVFIYNWGDFRGDPYKVLEKCFDAMLYMANWGSRQLLFRFPRESVDVHALEKYALDESEDGIKVSTTTQHVILDIHILDEELAGWIQSSEGILSGMVALREDILRGDYRALYVAWLNAARWEEDFRDKEAESSLLEPLVPANLRDLSAPLQNFIQFFDFNQDLIAVAAENSFSTQEAAADLADKIPELPNSVRNDLLRRILDGESRVDLDLKRHLRELLPVSQIDQPPALPRRTISELITAAQEHAQRRKEVERQKTQAEHTRKMEALAPKASALWEQVYALIGEKKTKAYDEAIGLILQLRDLSEYQGQTVPFQEQINLIYAKYPTLNGLHSRLHDVNLRKR